MSEQESSTISPFFNRVMSGMLRSPLHGFVSRSIMLITFTGRKTGNSYTTPISYKREDDEVVAFTHAKWSRNLVGGAPVSLYIKRKEYQGTADVIADNEEAVAEHLFSFLRTVRSDARFYDVHYDEDGEPNWADVRKAAENTYLLQITLNGAEGSS